MIHSNRRYATLISGREALILAINQMSRVMRCMGVIEHANPSSHPDYNHVAYRMSAETCILNETGRDLLSGTS